MFLQQDYEGDHKLLIYNNSPYKLKLDKEYPNVGLVNNHISLMDGRPYYNTGDIFRDALNLIPRDVEMIQFWDDDDIFLSNHISEGVKGYLEASMKSQLAYKPKNGYFRYMNNPQVLTSNVMEPSIFVNMDFVRMHGFKKHSSDYHSGWTDPLFKENRIFIKEDGAVTFIYDWSMEAAAFKISGAGDNPDNFINHKQGSSDIGDGIITPYIYDYGNTNKQ